jgi:hypothetical protein
LLKRLGSGAASIASKIEGKKEKQVVKDWTNNIKIGNEVFEIKNEKGKKRAILHWDKLRNVKDISGEVLYKNLKGVIILNGKFTLLENEKLNLILPLVKKLDIDNALSRKINGKKSFAVKNELSKIIELMPDLLSPCIWKKGKKEIGFICLTGDGRGTYHISCSRGFNTALNESLASLETLIDEMEDDVSLDDKNTVNQTYRRLSDMFE